MRLKRYIPGLCVAAALMATAMASCGDSGPYNDEVTSYDIVKFESQDKTGSVYTVYKPQSVSPVTYWAMHQLIDTAHVKVGERLLLAYVPATGVPYQSGNITVKGYSPINNDTIRAGYIAKHPDWNRDPVYMMSAWLAGDYLNVHCRLTYDTEPRTFRLLADSLSLDSPMPECYLMHTMQEPSVNFMRSYYVSFDISPLKAREGCRGLTLNLNNSNLPVNTFTFTFPE